MLFSYFPQIWHAFFLASLFDEHLFFLLKGQRLMQSDGNLSTELIFSTEVLFKWNPNLCLWSSLCRGFFCHTYQSDWYNTSYNIWMWRDKNFSLITVNWLQSDFKYWEEVERSDLLVEFDHALSLQLQEVGFITSVTFSTERRTHLEFRKLACILILM